VGSAASVFATVLFVQPWPCAGLLAFPTYAFFRPTTEHDGLYDLTSTNAYVLTTIPTSVTLLPAGKGLRNHPQGSYERIRYQIRTPSRQPTRSRCRYPIYRERRGRRQGGHIYPHGCSPTRSIQNQPQSKLHQTYRS
jgi:hypothetical protein